MESSVPITVTSVDVPVTVSKVNKSAIEVVAASDTVHVYCTEDTPADISPVGSQSNLSALSMPSYDHHSHFPPYSSFPLNDIYFWASQS